MKLSFNQLLIYILFFVKEESDILVGKLRVYCSICFSSTFYIWLVLVVKVDLHQALSVELESNSLSSDLRGINNIVQDSIVYSSQRTGARARTLGFLIAIVRLPEDGALGHNEYVTTRKFLFQFTNKPLVNFIKTLSLFERCIQKNCFFAASAVDLFSSSDVQIPQRCLEIWGSHLQVKEFLGNGSLEIIWLSLYD